MGTSRLKDLERARPEWSAWLAIVRAGLDEVAANGWQRTRYRTQTDAPAAPLLSRATIELPRACARRALDSVACAAREGGYDTMALAAHELMKRSDPLETLACAVNRRGAATDALTALGGIVALPLLHACAATARVSESCAYGYCPVCGSWPAFAEDRGVERSRHLRCADCGSSWAWSCLRCSYCGNADHDRLQSLAIEGHAGVTGIDVCSVCSGYLKVVAVLSATPAAEVLLRDLETLELDVAAAGRGYRRAPREAYPRNVRIEHAANAR